MSRLLLTILAGTLLLGGCDSAGPDRPPITEQTFGTEHYDAGLDLLQTSDGDLVVGGTGNGVIAPADGTIPTPNLTRLDADGHVLWSRLYDHLQGGKMLAVHENGSGYIALLRTGILTNDEDGLRLVAVGPNGRLRNTLYERAGITTHSNQTFRRTRDGGFILAGATPYTSDPRRAFLVRFDAASRVQWQRSFDDILYPRAVVQTTGNGFVLMGDTGSDAPAYDDVLLLNVGPEGSVRWKQAYGAEERQERGLALASVDGGGVVVVGSSDYYGEDTSEEWAYALNVGADGTQRWSATYGGEAEYAAQAITALRNDSFMLAGRRTVGAGETDALLIRINERGEEQWRTTFGHKGRPDRASAVIKLPDDRLAVTGTTGPDEPGFGGGDADVFVRFVPPDVYLTAP